ncbi:MAG TPA: glycosyltransferase, partial [Acetobacteraceae bacterium]|nr:glycosyltransferase [Acetobacteraceae bacterium]
MPGTAADPLARVTVVTVAYNSAGVLPGFLDSCPAGLRVIVVDNASHDGSAALAEARGARVIRLPENRGFGAGCNAGMEQAATEFTLLANPDSRLSRDAIAALVAAADAFPDAAILAPLIRDAGGARARSWDASQRRRRMLDRKRQAEPWPEGPLCVEFASGACLLVRASAGLRFDERLFLYYDDDDLCESARAAGHSILLVPDAAVTHAGGGSSTPSGGLTRFKAHHMALSRLIHMAKHQGEAEARAEARARLLHHAGKAIGHALTLRPRK